LQHDSRNRKANPSDGWETSAKGSLYWDVNNNTYAFWKISTDVTKYVHLFYDRAFGFRIAAEITEPVGGRKIPFYYLSELGRTETIRGFTRGRFRDKHMILGSLEYRFPLMKRDNFQLGLEACYFIDVGQVSENIFQEFSLKDLHVGFGGGFRLFSYNGRILQVLLSKSKDGFRLYVMLY
jgi:outer membrane protein assembly factor BamA